MLRLARPHVRQLRFSSDELIVTRLTGNHEGIAVIGLNRPKALNSISKNLVGLFENAMDDLKHDEALRCVIIRAMGGRAFCTGADLKERATMSPAEVGPFVSRLRRMVRDFQDLPVPTIAALDGFALGGGLEIAMSACLRTASNEAKMGLTETKLAIIPGAGGTQNLTRLIGLAKAKELMYTARMIQGEEAERLGLVNKSVPQNASNDAAYLAALALAEEIQPQGPIALRMAKMAISKGAEVDLNSALAFEQQCYAQVIPTQDRLEGLLAFKEKRKPVFKGK